MQEPSGRIRVKHPVPISCVDELQKMFPWHEVGGRVEDGQGFQLYAIRFGECAKVARKQFVRHIVKPTFWLNLQPDILNVGVAQYLYQRSRPGIASVMKGSRCSYPQVIRGEVGTEIPAPCT